VRSLLGTGVTLAGVIVIANTIAPQLLEHTIPQWKTNYGTIIAIAVILGFIRSIWRLIIPIVALSFWIIALYALVHSTMPTHAPLLQLPRIDAQSAQSAPHTVAYTGTTPLHGTKALPDAAFFAAPQTQGTGILSKIPGISRIGKILG
jgi:hypothetical protein